MRLAVLQASTGRLEEDFEDKRPLYDEGEALTEANRCLYCVDAPCIRACPTGIDIPTFIHKIASGNIRGAARTILTANLLGQSCGQVCPVEVLCAGACVYNLWEREPIAIGRLQRYAVEVTLAQPKPLFQAKPPSGRRIALVGSGPASLAAAGMLALEGHHCTVFEQGTLPGGLNATGIAPYKLKLPEALLEIEWVLSLGRIELRCGVQVVAQVEEHGQVSAQELVESFDAVFLGLGLGADTWLGIPGEEGPGVHGAVDLIAQLKLHPDMSLVGRRRAVVIGGGNTALDIAHELALLGLEVTLVYRRGTAEMSGYAHELEAARGDGVRLVEHRRPVAVVRDSSGKVTGLTVASNLPGELGMPETLPADLIAVAIGQSRATQVALAFSGVELDDKGRVRVDPSTYRTGHPRVWSGGDCVNGGREVVNAVAEAKVAVRDIQSTLGRA